MVTVIDLFHPFLFGNGKDGRPVVQCIHELLHKTELAFLSLLGRFRRIFVHGKKHLLITLVAEIIVRVGCVQFFAVDDFTHQPDGGVIFLPVFLFRRFDHDLSQMDAAGR